MDQTASGLLVPLTPPPTLPTSTLALPPADQDLLLSPKMGELDTPLLGLPSSSRSPDRHRDVHSLFSPLSSEWNANYDLLQQPSIPFNTNTYGRHGGQYLQDAQYSSPQPSIGAHNTASPQPHVRPMLPLLDIPELDFSPKSAWSTSPSSALDMDLEYDDDLDLLSTPTSTSASPFHHRLELDPDLPPNDHGTGALIFDATYKYPYSAVSSSAPNSPFHHKLDLQLTQDEHSAGALIFDGTYECPYGSLTPPPIHEFLPELQLDFEDIPDSPALRAFSDLPMDSDYDADDDTMMRMLTSPGPALLALPGAHTDDFLLPPDELEPELHPDAHSFFSQSLLLLDDSPEPEYDMLEVDLEFDLVHASPDAVRLAEIRRSRAARAAEYARLEGAAENVGVRWEARRARKREKQRGREVSEMLRLKLGECSRSRSCSREGKRRSMDLDGDFDIDASMHGEEGDGFGNDGGRQGDRKGKKKKKRGVRSMHHLVAQMLLQRNDTHRSLSQRKTPITSAFHVTSPLVRSTALMDGDSEHSTACRPVDDDGWAFSAPSGTVSGSYTRF
ncbi:hypothetical protein H0H81_008333 [Sphagnurus paluster]|uniref:Uncharacterized protein n=1 Tax=Sphagnurus paluster TaxID=117069 RepID=A0A9P7GPS9_9AGAR|nr:hypothetical protein H0H81_008333 [Sphagnurus paluster]